ncbi:unnamed protein product [Chilo suppressalis]|uniref:Nuclear respiratory factor 1 NLS/DNA-binding dimerisation domain-containing protein n=1 Tax=Chilo suppressalis TaxID=168631 RepID=A0ABN8B6M8_CHISP|nr:unnamed protein product [Chilo suppressalis]
MVLEVKRGHDEDSDTDFDIMNSAVSTESMDMAEEDMSQVEGCGLSGSEEDDECASSPAGSAYDDQDMIKTAMSDEVTKQLAAAGPVGMAAAAAIASSKKRKRPHSFETNPSVRKRHQNRLLRKLRTFNGLQNFTNFQCLSFKFYLPREWAESKAHGQ